jgi:hypothetical protein
MTQMTAVRLLFVTGLFRRTHCYALFFDPLICAVKVIYFNLPGNQSYATGFTHLASQLHTHKMQLMLQAENLTKRICSGNLDYKVQNAIPQNISILLAPFPFQSKRCLILLLMQWRILGSEGPGKPL